MDCNLLLLIIPPLAGGMESIMRKLLLILIILGSLLLISCGTSSSADLSVENTKVTPTSLPSVNQVLTPMEAFKAVLLYETTFFSTDKAPYNNVFQQWNGYLNELTYGDKPMVTPQFTVVDLDGDGVPEIVLAIEDYAGFVILRYKEGNVYGNIISYRTMENLKQDGSFMSSSGASDNTIGKMLFIDDTYFLDEKISSVGGANTISYYIHDMPIDQDTWDKSLASFDNSLNVEWHDYSKDVIDQWLIEPPVSSEIPALSKIAISDRQKYLDSLAYLIDLTISSPENQEKINENAQRYYNGCKDEMNKIYQMYLDKLTNSDREALIKEQQRWQENFDQRLSRFLSDHLVNSMDDLTDQSGYFEFGDMMLRRTFYLINLYYDYHFYD